MSRPSCIERGHTPDGAEPHCRVMGARISRRNRCSLQPRSQHHFRGVVAQQWGPGPAPRLSAYLASAAGDGVVVGGEVVGDAVAAAAVANRVVVHCFLGGVLWGRRRGDGGDCLGRGWRLYAVAHLEFC